MLIVVAEGGGRGRSPSLGWSGWVGGGGHAKRARGYPSLIYFHSTIFEACFSTVVSIDGSYWLGIDDNGFNFRFTLTPSG